MHLKTGKWLFLIIIALVAPVVFVYAQSNSGQQIFLHYKCNQCHSIQALDIKSGYKGPEDKRPPDLSKVGADHPADWFGQFLEKKVELKGKKHKKLFAGTDDELKTLTGWLATLKK